MANTVSWRDVFFADARDPGTDIGGLISTPTITNAVFHAIVAIAIGRDGATFSLQTEHGQAVARNAHPIRAGRYLVQSDEPVAATTRPFFTRALSSSAAARLDSFRQAVRMRDQGCVITKMPCIRGPQNGNWTPFQTAHVVPIAYANEWRNRDFARLITIPPPPPHHNDTINSVQNGLLMRSDLHQLFDSYHFSILPSVRMLTAPCISVIRASY